jgi:hypothetical protein
VTPEAVFLVCNYGVIPAWLLLAFAPRWSWTRRLVHAAWIPALLALVYATVLLTNPDRPEGAGFGSLPAVMAAFTSRQTVLLGWVHYLAFDLFVGAWEVRDAERRGIPHPWVIPCLFFTLMLGPIGLLLYLALRFVRTRAWTLEEAVA